jgi:uncharacterized protein (DUF1778 family)
MSAEKSKTERVEIRLGPEEKEAFQLAADQSGLSLSSWMRERLRRAARTDLEEAGLPVRFMATKTTDGD